MRNPLSQASLTCTSPGERFNWSHLPSKPTRSVPILRTLFLSHSSMTAPEPPRFPLRISCTSSIDPLLDLLNEQRVVDRGLEVNALLGYDAVPEVVIFVDLTDLRSQ